MRLAMEGREKAINISTEKVTTMPTMPIDSKELRDRVLVERVTVSYALTSGRRGNGDFVSLTVRAAEGDFTLDEAHLVHKIVSREAMEMTYMDALAKGHMGKDQITRDLSTRNRNYNKLIAGLERKFNANFPAMKSEIVLNDIDESDAA